MHFIGTKSSPKSDIDWQDFAIHTDILPLEYGDMSVTLILFCIFLLVDKMEA